MLTFDLYSVFYSKNQFHASSMKIAVGDPLVHEASAVDRNSGWCASKMDKGGHHWVQVDLGGAFEITKVGTLGYKGRNDFVSSYYLSYSNTGISWEVFKENGEKKV